METISMDVRNVVDIVLSEVRTSDTYCWRELDVVSKDGVTVRLTLFSVDVDDDALKVKA